MDIDANAQGLSRRSLLRALSYIESNLDQRITLDSIARAGCMSRFHFARMFRVSMDDSPVAYLRRARIERAKVLLACEDLTMSEIAAAVGFCDQAHFTRAFRRVTGATPGQFAHKRGLGRSFPVAGAVALPACSATGPRHALMKASRSSLSCCLWVSVSPCGAPL